MNERYAQRSVIARDRNVIAEIGGLQITAFPAISAIAAIHHE